MTPAARVAAAIDVLDELDAGLAAEQALTRWARKSRFAGSKDRAAVRDLVFDTLRVKQSAEALGGGSSGRALVLGLLRFQNLDPQLYFTGAGYGPEPLSSVEQAFTPTTDTVGKWNLPEWLVPAFQDSLGDTAHVVADLLGQRAPVTVRVHSGRATRTVAQDMLEADGVKTVENSAASTALTVTDGARKLRNASAYQTGVVEIQDAASQQVVALMPAARKCLDYCAGGGGKALAMAVDPQRIVYAHDADPKRMKDIQPRAEKAGTEITELSTDALAGTAPFDLVLCDAPCSGSGAWRRSPAAKWRFTQDKLQALRDLQQSIMSDAARLTAPDGVLVYATCSVLRAENEEAVATFLNTHPQWTCTFEQRIDMTAERDGFYTAHLTQEIN